MRKTDRVILILVSLVLLSAAVMLIQDLRKTQKSREEFHRMTIVKELVAAKVEAYKKENGHYPDSIAVLSFANSPEERAIEPDLPKVRYRRTGDGYAVGWEGVYVHSP
ncbi:MAG TPA: hypothetical protein VGO67_21185 [Verrucomicrobiae bacterium]|jgi:hypothetical protein